MSTGPSDAYAPLLPETLADGRYVVGDVLGSGGMGVVVAARDVVMERDVAVKLLADNLALDPGARRRFEAEARAVAGLQHPNIVQVFDVGEHAGRPYIVMERSGPDLRGRGAMPSHEVAAIARSVLAGLRQAHTVGTLHRDLKPANLLVATDGRIQITDFGIARAAEGPDLTATGLVVGTEAYLAPERLRGRPATERSDLYALGATLFQLLTGRPPATDQDGVPAGALPDDAPPGLRALVERCLARDPERRPEDVDAALALLAAETVTMVLPTIETATETLAIAVDGEADTVLDLEPQDPEPQDRAPEDRAPEDRAPEDRAPEGRVEPHWRGLGSAVAERPWIVLVVGLVLLLALAGSRGGSEPEPAPAAEAETTETVVPPLEPSGEDPATIARETAEWLRGLGG